MSTTQTWTDLSRRAVTVILVALCLIAVPAVASAKFTSAQTAGQTVGTDRMETPTGLSGSYLCTRTSSLETIWVTIDGFEDRGPAGATYAYTLVQGGTVRDSASTTSTYVTLNGWKGTDSVSTTWTVRIQPSIHRWTGGVATVSITCPATSTKYGTF